MIDIALLFEKMLMLFFMTCVGFVAGKTGVLTADGNHMLSKLINQVTTPCMVLYSALCNEHVLSNRQVFGLLGIALASYGILIVVSKLYMLLVRPEKEHRGLYEFLMVFPNLGFMGIPVISAIYGTDAVFYISIFIMVFYFVLYTYGMCLIRGISIREVNLRQIISPMTVSSLLGMILYLCNVRLPQVITEPMNSIGKICTPGAMLLTGSMLCGIPVGHILKNGKLFLAAAGKLFLAPIVTNLIFRHVITDEMILGVVTLITAMPVASKLSLLAAQYGKDENLAASAVFVTMVCSVVTIPLMAMLLL